MPRKRHVSRNAANFQKKHLSQVMPRKRHVSRNGSIKRTNSDRLGHASQEACE